VTTGGAVIVQAGWYVTHAGSSVAALGLGGVALVCGLGLLVGLVTPGAAAGVGVSTLAIAAASSSPAGLAADWRPAAFVAVDAIALALLGPGAHSIDAWLFGRREILVSDAPRRP
jgi:uncharacterized membrane protein YphA (DoxX/SURF4 family)